ncbi:SUN domain-containing ossification factor [Hyphodiscus hymeniophilus]|uniref:SUN domain-containing ossification factor n=1 Tax=Hyphodiscus hymeniophilus TaxID=353542 RepID=A0A9P6VIY8_9HELO|nr:SUN domain-containing ossification factor [Hyphodiscus hymeniophilus]
MLFACNWKAAAFLLFSSVDASTVAPKPTSTAKNGPATCEFRTINYITDSLPQQCLKSSWSNLNATTSTVSGGLGNATMTDEAHSKGTTVAGEAINQSAKQAVGTDEHGSAASIEIASSTSEPPITSTETAQESATDIESGELNEASFLSFEDWKKQTLEKVGQANANIGYKKSGGKRDSESIQNNLDSLGDEGEIELDFGVFRSGGSEEQQASEVREPDAQASQNLEGGRRKDQYRSKDAGITCKERFSYASFDAGATILKTHSGAKNSKAVLIENKDSYMLSECATENKFLIVELSEDIWIDTVVLANYEFFSSMIRTFRVSVSDRYPVKMDKWKDLGVYEARNSREIQAFLIENPQIWARYLRVEFLSHYGNEYYCPLSLLRVHGTRMLESWKETEASGDDDEVEEQGQGDGEHFTPDAVAEVVQEEERLNAELKEAQAAIEDLVNTAALITDEVEPALSSSHIMDINSHLQDATAQQMTTPWAKPGFEIFRPVTEEMEVCNPSEVPVQQAVGGDPDSKSRSNVELDANKVAVTAPPSAASVVSVSSTPEATSKSGDSATESPTQDASPIPTASNMTSVTTSMKQSMSSEIASAANKAANISSSSVSIAPKPQNATASQKNKTSSTSSASSSLPTIQESFFKAVSRRLQLLEANSTLSLKYIEEQSKILREAFTKVEKKQLQKSTSFLDTLNSTVLTELRGFRQQYDEIWQSTIISLESQREESRREILAISSRLNILADEVVFQKRMSIVQSVLLLLCLGLVIFSRVSASGHLDFPAMQARARNFGFPLSPLESPPGSPEYRQTQSGQWLETGEHGRDGTPTSRSRSGEDDDSPPTPVSFYSRSENALTPPSGADDPLAGSTLNLIEEQLEPAQVDSSELASSTSPSQEVSEIQAFSSPTVRTPKKRKTFIRQQSSPPPENSAFDSSPPRITTNLPSPQHAKTCETTVQDPTQEQVANSDRPPPLSAPLAEQGQESEGRERPSFSIARKPLPALPTDMN